MASSKLLCFLISLLGFILENFFVPKSVNLVRSNLPTPGGLCLFSKCQIPQRQVFFLALGSTFLREADLFLLNSVPSTLYRDGSGFALVSRAISSKQQTLGLVVTWNFFWRGLCLQSYRVRCSIWRLGSHSQLGVMYSRNPKSALKLSVLQSTCVSINKIMIIMASLRYVLSRFIKPLLLSNLLPHNLDPIVILDFKIKFLPSPHSSQFVLQEAIIWLSVEVQGTNIGQHFFKFLWQSLAQYCYFNGQLLLHDLIVLLFLALSLHRLPGQTASQEIQQHVKQRLQVVPPALLYSQVGVDGCIPGCSCEILIVTVCDVLSIFPQIPFGQSKIDHEDLGYVLSAPNKEVIRLEVTMQHSSGMNKFDQLQHLQPNKDSGLQGEGSVTQVQQVLQRISQQIHHHNVAVTFFPDVEHIGYIDLLPYFL